MLSRLLNFLFGRRSRVDKIDGKEFEDGFGIYDGRKQVDEWINIYEGNPPWLDSKIKESLNLGALIASDLARLTTIEFESHLLGENVEEVNKWYQYVINNIRRIMEFTIVQGGVVLKPYINNGQVYTEIIPGDEFVPLKFDGAGKLISAVFIYQTTQDSEDYTRLEFHGFDDNSGNYVISNRVFRGSGSKQFNTEVKLNTVDEWSDIEEVVESNINKPLFVYLTTPYANNKDIKSPLGVSVFTRTGSLLKSADRHWAEILKEYSYKQVRMIVPNDFVPVIGGTAEMNVDIDELTDLLIFVEGDNNNKIDVFSPDIRHESLFAGLEEIKRMLEFGAGLAFGSLSKVDNVEKTAEEIRSGKERSYNTVRDIQKQLRHSLTELADIIVLLSEYGGLVSNVGYDKPNFYFDDSIVIDEVSDINLMHQEVKSGMLKPEYYISKRYGISIEEAKDRIGFFGDNDSSSSTLVPVNDGKLDSVKPNKQVNIEGDSKTHS